MKITVLFFAAVVCLMASCSSTPSQSRDVASKCENRPSTEYHSYFEDYEKCKGW